MMDERWLSQDTSPEGSGSEEGDVERCRICRSAGTVKQPLHYPCKCAGSIKFVHQECLLHWLQHSSKNHCEVCQSLQVIFGYFSATDNVSLYKNTHQPS